MGCRRGWSVVRCEVGTAQAKPAAMNAPLPDIRQLMHEVQEHQKQLDKVRENYTYTSLQTVQDIDSNGAGEEDRDRGGRGLFRERPPD